MAKAYIVEKVYEIIISEEDLTPDEDELTADLAVEIAAGVDIHEWNQIDIYVAGTQ